MTAPDLQATIDRLALELARERAAHIRTREERDEAVRHAAAWRRVARWIHEASRASEEN